MKKTGFGASLLNRVKSFFTRNLGIKIIALIFALLLWAYVLVALNPVRNKSIDNVPITLEGYTDLLSRNLILVDSNLGLANVTVNASITSHADLDASRVNCRASLATITAAGTYRLPLSATVQSNLGTVASVNPATVTVEVDNLIVKSVPVRLSYSGALPEGYEIVSENMSSTITIEGAARYIEPAVRAVATVDLTDRTTNFDEAVNVTFFDKDGNELTVVTRSLNTPNVTVRLSLSAFKRVSVEEAVSLTDDTFFTLASEVSPSTVVLYGDSAALSAIESVSTESLVLPAAEDIVVRELPLVLPDGITLKRGQSNQVTVTCTVAEKMGERTLEVPITYLKLKAGLELAEDSLTFVNVSVSGPERLLEQLTTEDFSVQLDVSNYGAGQWELVPVLLGPNETKFPGLVVSLLEQRIQVELKGTAPAEPEATATP